MITVAYPDGQVEEYDLDDSSDTETYESKMHRTVRSLKIGEVIIIRRNRQ